MNNEGKHILLIDDDVLIHEAVKVILEPEGYRITCCLTGPDGMQAVRRERPDLVLLDIMLASPSEGFHLAYEMRNDDELRRIPIIMISAVGHLLRDIPSAMVSATGQATGADQGTERGAGYMPADDFLEKPIEAVTLRKAVERALDGKCSVAR